MFSLNIATFSKKYLSNYAHYGWDSFRGKVKWGSVQFVLTGYGERS